MEAGRTATAVPSGTALANQDDVITEVQHFLADHNICGGIEVDTCPPTSARGYRFLLTCCCGEFLDRWVTPEEALFDLVWSTQLYVGN